MVQRLADATRVRLWAADCCGSYVDLAHVGRAWDFCYRAAGLLDLKEYVQSGESSGVGRIGAGGGKIREGCVPRESSSAPGQITGLNTRHNLEVAGAYWKTAMPLKTFLLPD